MESLSAIHDGNFHVPAEVTPDVGKEKPCGRGAGRHGNIRLVPEF